MLLPTSLVGSYPQPDWLIDRDKLSKQVPRVRADDLWLVARDKLEAAQDDATILAIRDQERAGLDIVTDGEQRRESYSNRFATALEGIDTDKPGTTINRSGRPIPVPRVVGPIRRRHPVELRDLKVLRANTDRAVKATVPGPFTMGKQAQDDYYKDEEAVALAYADAVNAEIKDLFWLRRGGARQAVGLFVPGRARGLQGPTDLHRGGAAQARSRHLAGTAVENHYSGRHRPVRHDGRDAGDRCRAHSAGTGPRPGKSGGGGAGLRHEIPAARRGLW